MPFDHEQPAVSELPIQAIRVEGRFRRELGDIASLAASIAENGLFHPVVVTPDYRLIAGERRLRAMRTLGRTHVPVRVIPIDDIVRGEFAENVHRKDFTLSEMVAIGRAVEPLLKAQAKERQGTRTDKHPGKLPEGSSGQTRDHVARYCGKSGKTYERAKAVVAAAELAPDRFGALVEKMDSTGHVDGIHRKLLIAMKADTIRAEPPPLPGQGPYRVIVADPPWAYYKRPLDPSKEGTCPYPSMSTAEIGALPVAGIAHEDAIVWLWTTNAHLREAFGVLDAWGFEHKTVLT